MERRPLLAGIAFALCAGAATPAAAVPMTVVQTGSHGPDITDWTGAGAGSYTLFDSSLGTLTGVEFLLTGAISSVGTVTNPAAGTISYIVRVLVDFYVDAAGPLPTIFTPDFPQLANITASQSFNLEAGATAAFGPRSGSGSADYTASTAQLAAFIDDGSGQAYQLDLETVGGLAITGNSGNIVSQLTTTGTATWRLTYTYEPAAVPEPGALALLGAGLVGLGLVRRRRHGA